MYWMEPCAVANSIEVVAANSVNAIPRVIWFPFSFSVVYVFTPKSIVG